MKPTLRRSTNLLISLVVLISMLFPGVQPNPASAQAQDDIRREYNAETGKVAFITGEGRRPVAVLGSSALGMTPEAQSLALVQRFAPEFGLTDPSQELRFSDTDQPTADRVVSKYQQVYQGVPVMAAELIVNANKRGELISINGEVSQGLSLDTNPKLTVETAIEIAKKGMVKWYGGDANGYSGTQASLWIFDEILLRPSLRPAELVWRVEMGTTQADSPIRELVLVDAQTGNVSLHFNQVDTAWIDTGIDPQLLVQEFDKIQSPAETLETIETPASPSNGIKTNGGKVEMMLQTVATTWYVATTGDDASPCSAPNTPCLTIDAAVTKAVSGDTILIQQGTYSKAIISKSLNLKGGWNDTFSSQSGISILDEKGNTSTVLYITSNANIERLSIQNGYIGIWIEPSVNVALRQSSVYSMRFWGIHNRGNLLLENSTISGNQYSGIDQYFGTLSIVNSTITNNSSSGTGTAGGVVGGTITIQNSILAVNSKDGNPSDCYGTITSLGNNIIGTTSDCSILPQPSDLVGTNPQVSAFLGIGYHALFSNSPAINTANAGACPALDQRGVSRPEGANCDIGAYEYTTPGPAGKIMVQTGAFQITGLNSVLSTSLKALVLDSLGSPRSGVAVAFTAPITGPSGVFSGSGTNQTMVVSDINGIASASAFTSNLLPGFYTVIASIDGVSEVAGFPITNIALYVKLDGNDSLDCLTPATACSTITGALAKAQPNAKIFIAGGIYTSISPFGISPYEVVYVNKNISLSGGWNSSFSIQNEQTIIDGQNSRDGINITASSIVNIEHITINKSFSGIMNRGTVNVINSSLTNNRNGVDNQGILNITNSTASQNSSYGIANHSTIIIQNSTITNNNAAGIYSGASITLQNSILAGNGSGTTSIECEGFGGIITSVGNNIIGSISGCGIAAHATDMIGIDPQLSPLLNDGFHALYYNSPAINAANLAACPATDQRGIVRPVGAGCDIGSTEYSGTGTVPAYVFAYDGTPQYIPVGGYASPGLKAVVLDKNGGGVSGIAVTFSAPLSGASGIFVDTNTNTSTTITDINGVASPSVFFANTTNGSYIVEASSVGLINPAKFELSNGSQIHTYTASNGTVLPGTILCNQNQLNCTNGNNPHADAAHQHAIGTHNMYVALHNRNSVDNNGMAIVSTVHYDTGYANAFWNGSQMVYGDAYAYPLADDVVAHELTHGVTQYESNLFYFYQSGAINESFSDLWGEYYDQTNGLGTDTPNVKWIIGDDALWIRNMAHPPYFADPDKMTSQYYSIGNFDNGGVHKNSGVNNKAVFLMVDGSTFNGITVSALGWDKTEAIYYEVQTNLLSSGSDYSDLYYAVQQACANLTGQLGITSGDCLQVKNALDAVEMNSQPIANYNPDAPVCETGTTVIPLFQDNMEGDAGKWAMMGAWSLQTGYASSSIHMLYGDDIYPSSDSSATMAAGVPLPVASNMFLHFKHAFAFEYDLGGNYDGGVLEYSINNGFSWVDASPLFAGGQNYTGPILNYNGTTNALKGRNAFVGDSHGYVSSRYDLTSLGGQTIKFRWRFATDNNYYYLGWMVDDVQIYSCDATLPVVTSIVRANFNPNNLTTVQYTVNFSRSVTGVDISDFTLAASGVSGAAVSGIGGSGSLYTVTVNTGSGDGAIRLDLVDNNSIIDAFSIPLGGAGAGDGSFTSGQTYTITKSLGRDTAGVFRPSNGLLYLKNAHISGFADVAINYGLGGDYPVTGDWNGDGIDTIGIYRNGSFYLRNSNTLGFADIVFAFGQPGDQPVAGDWDGNGVDTIGIYRNGLFLLRNSNSAGAEDISFYLGNPGDVGIAGDWNGDGADTTGVFRPSNGVIFLKNLNTSGFADININYGLSGDMPVTGDWNNDGIDTIGVYRNAQFLLRNSNTIGFADIVFALGNPGDMPIAGNWDALP